MMVEWLGLSLSLTSTDHKLASSLVSEGVFEEGGLGCGWKCNSTFESQSEALSTVQRSGAGPT